MSAATQSDPVAVFLLWDDGSSALSGWPEWLAENPDVEPEDVAHLRAGGPVVFGGGAAPQVTVTPLHLTKVQAESALRR